MNNNHANSKGAITQRRQKLESIKSFISLKTYNLILEKLESEEKTFAAQLQKIDALRKQQSMEQQQSLPKTFFEQEYLNPKSIRIE